MKIGNRNIQEGGNGFNEKYKTNNSNEKQEGEKRGNGRVVKLLLFLSNKSKRTN